MLIIYSIYYFYKDMLVLTSFVDSI